MIVTFIGEMTKKSLGATSLAANAVLPNTSPSALPPNATNARPSGTRPSAVPPATTPAPCVHNPTLQRITRVTNCRAEHSCNHPPIRCANCLQPHKASDRSCSTYVKITLGMRRDNAATTDTTMAA